MAGDPRAVRSAGANSGLDFNRFAAEVAVSSARVLLHLLSVLG
ncbi:hypothetical protein MSG_00205 [Mycobacterium shigaense]|uniref:Uncharacterized protein n=1 Tax=Mycobacterium shigaense TaxID=722731 RepID=A0A1Z4EBM8_9MYCO|nr:hypothetical protein MSG_00205 [Mycobacterium shigaense]